jgi:hypothetical protein
MPSPDPDTSYSELLRSLVADERCFRQALQSTPAPSLATSVSNLRRLLLAGVRRIRKALRPHPLLYLKLESLKFFESGLGGLKAEHRRYATSFPQQTTRNVNCEVEVRKLWRQRTIVYPLVYRYYTSDGSLLGELRGEWRMKSKWQSHRMSWGWGWSYSGQWRPGEYVVQILLDGMEIGKGRFAIVPPEPPPPPRPLAENLQLISVRFYVAGPVSQADDWGPGFELLKFWESMTSQKEARQYNIRFPREITREVFCELTVRSLLYRERNQTYHVTAQCYTAEEKLLWEDHHDWLIKSEEQESSISWGWQTPGQWEAGVYRVEILIEGTEFAWGAFLIEEPAPVVEKPPPTHNAPKNTPEKRPQRRRG